ncbi:hypothetical protein [Frankia canadensis]|uniref:hypothetical protein n=1 Tax=Frankia canadensis TaxID=1836972 RepID=UPI00105590E9|nr:hypothetical protein [Frankia canadensis]
MGDMSIQIGGARVVVAPGLTVALAELPLRSIALDGVVQGPELDVEGQRFSFDHHGDCVRLVTSATCRQVQDAILLGLEPSEFTVYVNDVDADTVLAVALLAHSEWLAEAGATPTVTRRLVEAVGSRDAHGPAYPVADRELLARFAEALALPVRRAGVAAMEIAEDLTGAVARVAALIARLAEAMDREVLSGVGGEHKAAPRRPSDSFVVTHSGTGWTMATSDVDALDEGYAHGFHRMVMWRRLGDGSTAYTVARRSDLVGGFPVGPASRPGTILAALAAREPGWGGGTSIGGAPRHPDGGRSALSPDEVFHIVEGVVVALR